LTTSDATVHWSLAIAPVQQWIAEARRSRDLLAGSAILSWLMARLLQRVLQARGELILPGLTGEDLEIYAGGLFEVLRRDRLAYGIPNRASGILHGSIDEAEGLFGSLEGELASGWEEIRDEVARSAPAVGQGAVGGGRPAGGRGRLSVPDRLVRRRRAAARSRRHRPPPCRRQAGAEDRAPPGRRSGAQVRPVRPARGGRRRRQYSSSRRSGILSK
jgi:hypothetical protein